MLNTLQKIEFFKEYLCAKNENYGDKMKEEIYFCFFENRFDINFLNSLNTNQDIENKVEFLVSKMILHDHEDGLDAVILNYL